MMLISEDAVNPRVYATRHCLGKWA